MFSLVLIYVACGITVWWSYSGYMYYLFLYNLFRRLRKPAVELKALPTIAIIVPVYNEDELMAAKLEDLIQLDYPAEVVRIVVVDASSSDGTIATARRFAAEHPERSIEVLNSERRGRCHQINLALRQGPVPDLWVLTDADTLLERSVLREIAAEFARDPRIGVVGAWVEPAGAMTLEQKYWQYQNVLRWMESNIYSTSIVVGPCYAFKPGVIDAIPDDCASDDIHICFAANARGYMAKYLLGARVKETRTPATIPAFLNHKFRKGNAYIIELLRFLYLLPTYNIRWKIVYLTKCAQILVMPFATVFFGLVGVNICFVSVGYFYAVLTTWIFMFLNVLATSLLIRYYYKAQCKETVSGEMLRSFVLTNLVLICGLLAYLIYFQDSRPEKVSKEGS